jgi:alcohol dehydrogenase class IV
MSPGQSFEFATASRILFGSGTLAEVAPFAARQSRRALMVTGSTPGRADSLRASLAEHGLSHETFSFAGEPTIDSVREGTRFAQQAECDLVIALGGGSVMDCAKAIAGLMTNPGEVLDYLEVIGRGRALTNPAAPWIAIPTTAGAGAEVTRNAVIASPAHRVKASLRSPLLLARLAVIDPLLTHALPPAITASTGLDALTQLIEPYVSIRANPMTDAICVEGLPRVARSLRRVVQDGTDATAREEMALAALFGGMALANAGLGAVHGLAAPIGGMFPAPHGAVCAALLRPVMEMNLRALRERQPHHPALRRYDEIARLLTGNMTATAEAGAAWVKALCADLSIPPLRAYGVKAADLDEVCDRAAQASSMKGNPIALKNAELREIMHAAL